MACGLIEGFEHVIGEVCKVQGRVDLFAQNIELLASEPGSKTWNYAADPQKYMPPMTEGDLPWIEQAHNRSDER
jgi:hypothetical protein